MVVGGGQGIQSIKTSAFTFEFNSKKTGFKPRGLLFFNTLLQRDDSFFNTHTIPTSFKGRKSNLDERFNMPLGGERELRYIGKRVRPVVCLGIIIAMRRVLGSLASCASNRSIKISNCSFVLKVLRYTCSKYWVPK